MKKQSVLIQRAILFTAIVTLVAVAVGLPTFLLLNNYTAGKSAREALLPQARVLAQDAANGERFTAGATVFQQMEHESVCRGYT